MSATVLPGIVIERCIATSLYTIYEASVGSCFSNVFCIIQAIFVIGIIIFGTIFFPNSIEKNNSISICQHEFLSYDFTLYITYIVFASAIISIISFLILLNVNKHLYSKAITNFANGYLTKKFQLSENIKICRLMCPCIVIYFFGLIVCSGLIITASKIPKNRMLYEDYVTILHCFGQGVDIIVASVTSCFCLYAMSKFKKLKLRIHGKSLIKNAKVTPLEIKGICGNDLILNIENGKDLYFAELNKQWYKK